MKLELNLTPQQIELLREGLDELPLAKYITVIVPLLQQLPLESAAGPDTGTDSAPAPLGSREAAGPLAREVAGGFSLTAYTPRGVSMMDALERVLSRLPHTGDI